MRANPQLLAGITCLVLLLSNLHAVSIPLNIVEVDDQDRLVYNQLGILGLSNTKNAFRLMKHARKRIVSVTATTANKFYNSSDPKSTAQYTYRFGLSLIQRVSWLAHPLAEFVKVPGLNRVGFECGWVVGCIREAEKEVFYDIPLKKSKSAQQAFVESSPFNFTTSDNTKVDVRVPFFLVKDYPLSWQFPIDGILTLRKSAVMKKQTITPNIFNNQDFNMQLGNALKSEHANGPKWALDINRGSGKSFLHFDPKPQQITDIGKPGVPMTWFPVPTAAQNTRLMFTSISNCTLPNAPTSGCKTLPVRFRPILTIEDDANMYVGLDIFSFIGITISTLPATPSCDISDSSRMYCFFRDLKDLLTLPEIHFGYGGQQFPVDLKALVNSCYLNHEAFYVGRDFSQYKFVCQMELKLRNNRESIGLPFFYRNLVVFDEGTSSIGVVAKSNLSTWNAFSVSEIIDVNYMKQLKDKTGDQILELFREKYKRQKKAGPQIVTSPDALPTEAD